MTRRHLTTLRLLFMLADGLIAALVFLGVSVVRFEDRPGAMWSVGFPVEVAAALFALLWVAVFWSLGLYHPRIRWGLFAEARDVIRGTVVVLAATLSLLFLLHQDAVSRLFLAMVFVAQPSVALLGRAALRRWFEGRRTRGRDPSHMVIVGTGPLAQEFADRIEGHRALGLRVIGHLRLGDLPATEVAVTRDILGSIDDLSRVFREHVVDEVSVCLPAAEQHFLEAVVTVAAGEGKTVRVPTDPEEGVLRGAIHEEFDRYLIRSVAHDGQRDLERALKRLMDVVGATTALIVLSPIILFGALAIRLGEGSPVLFRQQRIGLHGRRFSMLKFRTMEPGAEERLAELIHRNEVSGPAFKVSDDPRITPIGALLRASSIDELPQLINVLKGEMSLVGPRPALPHEVAEYDIWHRRRLSVRPGITGLWQIEARSDGSFDNWAALDLRYIDQWSIWTDAKILAKTLPAVLFSRGR